MVKLLVFVSLLTGTVMAQRGRPTTTVRATAQNPSATQSLYGQCGGQQWTGPTACPTGAYCANNDNNVWYSQCLPVAQNNPQQSSSLAEVRTLTTAITIDGPFPTVITTRITYLQPRPSSTPPVEVVTVTLVPDEPCEHDFYC
ncbi:hypothetical protein B0T14DRAFT_565758 [Immersiella caudata]|uniref:CBM1 domain-containing protein n=1 Tax=Immersiella caudata TaxID=314043 RepID=A0AA39WNU2_9PEZI|nr:hypothetical protein B0T14DRAFT_565758 [Immersiella caudata]